MARRPGRGGVAGLAAVTLAGGGGSAAVVAVAGAALRGALAEHVRR